MELSVFQAHREWYGGVNFAGRPSIHKDKATRLIATFDVIFTLHAYSIL